MMQIGDLAAKAGTTTRTIRYYEELGIVEPVERSEGGFRLYSEVHLRRLRVVQGLKTLGFDLERIRELFSLHSSADTGGDLSRAMIQVRQWLPFLYRTKVGLILVQGLGL